MLRLMGAGAVQIEAIQELQRLPRDAWERAVASRHLVALRMELPQDGSDEDREFLMNSLKLVDDMLERHGAEAMKRGREQGLEQGRNEARLETLRQAIRTIYESRFGAMPPALVTALEVTEELPRLEAWLPRAAVASAEDIAALLSAASPGA